MPLDAHATKAVNRRLFVGQLTAAAGSALFAPRAVGQARPRVVIVGGGAGGATVAHQLVKASSQLDVTLVEAQSVYAMRPFANHTLGGVRAARSIFHGYGDLRSADVRIAIDTAHDVDTARKTLRLAGGQMLPYDRLVLSPGIALKYDSIAGYSIEASLSMPHAWTGASGILRLARQLQEMRDGGTVVLVAPGNPYSCPPAPYERACLIAHYLKTRKPRSKLIILDPKRAFSKQPVFMEAFDKYYQGIIELNLTTEIDDYAVERIDPRTKEIITKAGKTVRADVANIIPQQRAGEIAIKAGCTEGDWCPINPDNFTSKKVRHIYVLGDASIAAEMPKSAFSASSQAKVVAADMLAELDKGDRFPARYRNTCWSFLAPDDSVKIGANYAPRDGKLDPSGAFVSQRGEAAEVRKQNYQESVGWYTAVTNDMFARRT